VRREPADEASAADSLAEGAEVDRYVIGPLLGYGGMAVVFAARDPKLSRDVALKVLRKRSGGAAHEIAARMRREAQVMANLSHPNIVTVFDIGTVGERVWIAMEKVDGGTLRQWLKTPRTWQEIVATFVQAGRGLAAAHDAGIVHRDFKPDNVLVGKDGRARVADFGLAYVGANPAADEDLAQRDPAPIADDDIRAQPITDHTALVGTPGYMAPEQARTARTHASTDQFSFCVSLYEALCGELPFEGRDVIGIVENVRAGRFKSSAGSRRIPRHVKHALRRGMSLHPSDRFPSMYALLAALEEHSRPVGRWRAAGGGALAVALVAGAALVLALGAWARRQHPSSTSAATSSPSIQPASGIPSLDLHVSNVRRLTFGESCEEFPSFTPDGRSVLFDAMVGPDSFIERLNLTPGAVAERLTSVRGWDIAASISPQGDRFAFLRLVGDARAAYVAPLDRHEPPHLVAHGSVRPSWTEDGTAIWAGDGSILTAYEASSGAVVRTMTGAPAVKSAITAEVGDGRVAAALFLHGTAAGISLWSANDGLRWLYRGSIVEVLALTGDRRHVVASRMTPTGLELIDVPLDGSPTTSLASSGIEPWAGLAFSRDGRDVVWSACKPSPQLAAAEARGALRPLEGDLFEVTSVAPVPGRPEVVVVSAHAGKPEPWIVSLSGSVPPRPFDIGALTASELGVSSDGRTVVVSVPGRGLFTGSLEGGPLRSLTGDPMDSSPRFRFGDAEVLFTRHLPNGKPRIMSVPFAGGEAEPLLDVGTDFVAPSPTEDRIAFLSGGSAYDYVPMLWEGRTKSQRRLSIALRPDYYDGVAFSTDGRRIAVVRGQHELVEVRVSDGEVVRTLTTPNNDLLEYPAYTAATLVVVQVRWKGNLWLANIGP
jgi:serine/threonine protein kinase